jgi:chromatin remodeling complex protein RSC6
MSIYIVLARDSFDRCAVHGCTTDKKLAVNIYDSVSDRVANYNEECKERGNRKRDVVELLQMPQKFNSDIGYTAFTGYDEEGASCLLNNVRDDDKSDSLEKRKTRGAFFRPILLSDVMCKFFDRPNKTVMSRSEASRLIGDYVKKHNLIDAKNPRLVKPDPKLRSLFEDVPPAPDSIFGDDRVKVFDLHRRLIAHHFIE